MVKKIKDWSDISIEKFIKLYNLKNINDLDDIDILINELCIIYDLTDDEVESLPMEKINSLRDEMYFISTEPKQTNVKNIIEIDGINYYLKNNLNTLTYGEWKDLKFYESLGSIENLHKINSILYTNDINEKYNPEKSDVRAEIFYKKMDVETATSSLLFFYLFLMNYVISDIQGCSLLDRIISGMEELKKKKK